MIVPTAEQLVAVDGLVERCGVDALAVVLGALQARDVTTAASDRLRDDAVALSRIASRVSAERLRVVGELQRREPPRAGRDGVQGTLEREANLGRAGAHREAQLARDLAGPRLAATRDALAEGRITPEHAKTIADAARRSPALLDGDGQAELLDVARTSDVQALRDEISRREERANTEDAARRAERQHRARDGRAYRRADGMVRIEALMHPDGGASFLAAISALSPPDPATVPEDQRRTAGQRFADGLERMARLTLAHGDAGQDGGLEPSVTVHHRAIVLPADVSDAGEEAELDWVGRICGETATRLACDATHVTPVVREDGTTVFVDERRYPNRKERRALVGRDGGCRFTWPDGTRCNEPPAWCDAHHITFHGRGGPTVVRNLLVLCSRHHVAVHEGGWRIEGHPDRDLTFHPPRDARAYWDARVGAGSVGTSSPIDRPPPTQPTLHDTAAERSATYRAGRPPDRPPPRSSASNRRPPRHGGAAVPPPVTPHRDRGRAG